MRQASCPSPFPTLPSNRFIPIPYYFLYLNKRHGLAMRACAIVVRDLDNNADLADVCDGEGIRKVADELHGFIHLGANGVKVEDVVDWKITGDHFFFNIAREIAAPESHVPVLGTAELSEEAPRVPSVANREGP